MFLGFSLFQVTQWITAAGMSVVRYMKTILRVGHHTNPISEQVLFKSLILLAFYDNKNKWLFRNKNKIST